MALAVSTSSEAILRMREEQPDHEVAQGLNLGHLVITW